MTAIPTTQIAAPKHIPERTCVACRSKRPQAELVRLTQHGGHWAVQTGRQRIGRGAYLCADNTGCWQEKKLRRTFRGQAEQVAAYGRDFIPRNESGMGQPMND